MEKSGVRINWGCLTQMREGREPSQQFATANSSAGGGVTERAGCNAGVEEVAYNVVIKGDQYADT